MSTTLGPAASADALCRHDHQSGGLRGSYSQVRGLRRAFDPVSRPVRARRTGPGHRSSHSPPSGLRTGPTGPSATGDRGNRPTCAIVGYGCD